MVHWKVSEIFNVLGGVQGVATILEKQAPTECPNLEAVRAWKRRGSIPGQWLAPLVQTHIERHSAEAVRDWLTGADDTQQELPLREDIF